MELAQLGISPDNILVTVRPPASEALYHRFENELFEHLLNHLAATPNTKVVLLPRSETQRQMYGKRSGSVFIVPSAPLDGANLIAHSDLVVSAGGTMNREAAALGVPAISIYAGEWAAIDEELLKEGRLQKIATREDIDNLKISKKGAPNTRNTARVITEVTDLILE
jgi:predicted glycosyltransferase